MGDESARPALDAIAAFQLAGLEAENPRPLTRDDYGTIPFVGRATSFQIPSLGPDKGGRIFVGSPEQIDGLTAHFAEQARASPAPHPYIFTIDNLLIEISGDMKAAQAAKYEAALQAMK